MTEHLTFEELVEFNSLELAELKASELSLRVTAHIRACRECRDTLAAIQNAEEALDMHIAARARKQGIEGRQMPTR